MVFFYHVVKLLNIAVTFKVQLGCTGSKRRLLTSVLTPTKCPQTQGGKDFTKPLSSVAAHRNECCMNCVVFEVNFYRWGVHGTSTRASAHS